MAVQRQLAAVLTADVVGLMLQDVIQATLPYAGLLRTWSVSILYDLGVNQLDPVPAKPSERSLFVSGD